MGLKPLMVAASCGSPNLVEILLKDGADIDARNICGATALMCAIMENDKHTALKLLYYGANIDIKDKEENTARLMLEKNGWFANKKNLNTSFVRCNEWLKFAQEDANCSSALINYNPPFIRHALYYAQQGAEKSMKGYVSKKSHWNTFIILENCLFLV